jgi:hypothetical protein
MAKRSMPGWVRYAGYGVAGLSLVGLPVALGVVMLDTVRRSESVLAQRTVLAVLVILATALVVAAERGLVYGATELGIKSTAGIAVALVLLVLLGVFVPGLGLVLLSIGLLVGFPALLAGCGALAWWRWKNGPRLAARVAPPMAEVRDAAEARRVVVRARHDRTREAVAQGLIGPGFTKGR